MTKREIVERLADERVIENLAGTVCRGEDINDLNDLIQDLYENLLGKDEEKIVRLYEDGEMEYFVYRMITNQVYSKTSPYYKKYKMTKTYEQLPYYDQEDTDD